MPTNYTAHLAVAPLVSFILWLVTRLAQRAFRNLSLSESASGTFFFPDSDSLVGARKSDMDVGKVHTTYIHTVTLSSNRASNILFLHL